MPSPIALRFIAAGFLTSLLIWSLLPDPVNNPEGSEWAEVPSEFGSGATKPDLQARTKSASEGWVPAKGERGRGIDLLNRPRDTVN